MPFFLSGVLAYIGFMRRREPLIPAWVFLPLIGALAAFYSVHYSLPTAWITVLLIGLLLPIFREARNGFVVRAGHAVAKYSYGIYLLHQLSLALAFYYLPLRSAAAKIAVEMASLAVLAPLAYHLVEHPMVRLGSRIAGGLQRRYGHVAQARVRGVEFV